MSTLSIPCSVERKVEITRHVSLSIPKGTYRLTIKVYGVRGQGLGPLTVTISPVGIEVMTDESGVVTVELPEGTYTIHVNYRGIEDEKSITLTGEMTQDFRLDVYVTILGRPFRTAEFFQRIVILFALFIALVIVFKKKLL